MKKSFLQYEATLDIIFIILVLSTALSIEYKILSYKQENIQSFWSTSQFFEWVTLMNMAWGMVPGDIYYNASLEYEIPEIRFFTTDPQFYNEEDTMRRHYIIAGFTEREYADYFKLIGCVGGTVGPIAGGVAATVLTGGAALPLGGILVAMGTQVAMDCSHEWFYLVKDIVNFQLSLYESLLPIFGGCGCNKILAGVFTAGYKYDDSNRIISDIDTHGYFFPLNLPVFVHHRFEEGNLPNVFTCNENKSFPVIGDNIYFLPGNCICEHSCNNTVLFVQRKATYLEFHRIQKSILGKGKEKAYEVNIFVKSAS